MWYKFVYKNPMELLVQHFALVKEVYYLAKENFKRWCEGKEVLLEEIDRKEHEADEVNKVIVDAITINLISSLRSGDLLMLAYIQDSVADIGEDLSKFLDFKKFTVRKEVLDKLNEIFEITDKCIEIYSSLIDNLFTYYKASFANKYKNVIPEEIYTISQFEKQIDDVQHVLGKIVYNLENENSAIEIYFLSKMTIIIDTISDKINDAAKHIKRMIAK